MVCSNCAIRNIKHIMIQGPLSCWCMQMMQFCSAVYNISGVSKSALKKRDFSSIKQPAEQSWWQYFLMNPSVLGSSFQNQPCIAQVSTPIEPIKNHHRRMHNRVTLKLQYIQIKAIGIISIHPFFVLI